MHFISNCKINLSESDKFADTISKQETLLVLYIFDSNLGEATIDKICTRCLNSKPYQLKELFIHTTHPCSSLTSDLFKSTYHNTSTVLVTKNALICQRPTSEQIVFALQLEPDITRWKCNNCHVDPETYYCIIANLFTCKTCFELNVSACNIRYYELHYFKNYLKHYDHFISHLASLNISCNKITSTAVDELLEICAELTEFNISSNYLEAAGAIKISTAMNMSKST